MAALLQNLEIIQSFASMELRVQYTGTLCVVNLAYAYEIIVYHTVIRITVFCIELCNYEIHSTFQNVNKVEIVYKTEVKCFVVFECHNYASVWGIGGYM